MWESFKGKVYLSGWEVECYIVMTNTVHRTAIFKKASFRCAAVLKIMSLFWRSWGWNVTNLRSSFLEATAISNLRKKMYTKLNKTNKQEHRRNRKQLSGWRISCKLCIFSLNIFFFWHSEAARYRWQLTLARVGDRDLLRLSGVLLLRE